jgi:hypothetical protein
LYNLETDPGERTNVYSKHPEIVAKLQERLQQYQRSGRSAPAQR